VNLSRSLPASNHRSSRAWGRTQNLQIAAKEQREEEQSLDTQKSSGTRTHHRLWEAIHMYPRSLAMLHIKAST